MEGRTRRYSTCVYITYTDTVYTRAVYATTHAHTIFKFKIAVLFMLERGR